MQKINVLILLFLLKSVFLLGQKKDVYDLLIPETLENCFDVLNKTLENDEILLIKTLPEDSIYDHPEFNSGTDFFHAWKLYEGSKLTKYFNKKGLYGSFEIYETILISYHRYLNNKPINLDELIRKYILRQEKEHDEYILKTEQDSINGIYIPKNLEECFLELDRLLSEEDRNTIKELKDKKETIKYHHGLGTLIRNMWGLWGGSRLQALFIKKNVHHPDEMSYIILEFYYDWLHNKNEDWIKW
jgi:hypothetical protein